MGADNPFAGFSMEADELPESAYAPCGNAMVIRTEDIHYDRKLKGLYADVAGCIVMFYATAVDRGPERGYCDVLWINGTRFVDHDEFDSFAMEMFHALTEHWPYTLIEQRRHR